MPYPFDPTAYSPWDAPFSGGVNYADAPPFASGSETIAPSAASDIWDGPPDWNGAFPDDAIAGAQMRADAPPPSTGVVPFPDDAIARAHEPPPPGWDGAFPEDVVARAQAIEGAAPLGNGVVPIPDDSIARARARDDEPPAPFVSGTAKIPDDSIARAKARGEAPAGAWNGAFPDDAIARAQARGEPQTAGFPSPGSMFDRAPWDAVADAETGPEQSAEGGVEEPGDIMPGRAPFDQTLGAAQSPADRAEQARLTTPIDPYDPVAVQNRIEQVAEMYRDATPEEQAKMIAREERLFETQRQTLDMKAAEDDRKAMEENVAVRNRARAKTDADMASLARDTQAMADSSPFESWWHSRTTGGQIANAMAAVFGGLLSPQTGGRNSAIDTMMKIADSDADQKWKKIQERRVQIGDARANAGEDFLESEKIRAASREQVARYIQAQMAGLDPEGTQALKLGQMLAGVQQAGVEAAAKAGATLAAQNERDAKQAIEEYKALDAHDQWAAADQLARAKFNRAGMAGAAKQPGLFDDKASYTVAEWVRIRPQLAGRIDPTLFAPDQKLTGKDVKDLLGIDKELGNIGESESRKGNVDQSKKQGREEFLVDHQLLVGTKPLLVYEADGKTPKIDPATGEPEHLVVRGSTSADMQKKISNATQVLRWLDEAKVIRNNASVVDLKNPGSKAYQQLNNLAVNVQLSMKDGTQGMSSDADGSNLASSAGVANLRSVFDQDASLDAARRNLTNKVNNDLVEQFGYNGPVAFSVENSHAGAKRKENTIAARLSNRAVKTTMKVVGPVGGNGIRGPAIPVDERTDDQNAALGEAEANLDIAEKASKSPPGETEEQKAAHAETLALGDETAAGLVSAATNGQRAPAREGAAALLWSRKQKGNPAAVAAFNRMSPEDKAAFIANLPFEDAKAVYRELLTTGKAP